MPGWMPWRSRKASRPKSMARCVPANPPGSRTSRKATTRRRVVPFLNRGCIGWRSFWWDVAGSLIPPYWRRCAGGPVVVPVRPSNEMNKRTSCSSKQRTGDNGSCMSLTRARPAVSGSACSLLSSCALCCDGRKSISWWMRRARANGVGLPSLPKEQPRCHHCGMILTSLENYQWRSQSTRAVIVSHEKIFLDSRVDSRTGG